MNRYEKISSLVWLMASIAIIGGSSVYSFGAWSHPGPGFLPLWCGIIMAALSLIVLIQSFYKEKGQPLEKKEGSFFTPRWLKLVAVLIILFAYAFLLEIFGFILITFVFMVFVLKVVEPRKWSIALVEAGSATIVSYALFELWLKVLLPKGFWPTLF